MFTKLASCWILIQIFCGVESRVGESKGSYEKPVKECLIDGKTIQCESGACCQDACCPFYYELWWFWLIWALTIMMSCCCAYHHRKKQRMQRLDHNNPAIPAQDNYVGGSNYPGPPIDDSSLGYAKLPLYNDVIRIPPTSSPPPPYSSRKKPVHHISVLEATDNGVPQMRIVECNVTSSMLSLASINHWAPKIVAKHNIKTIYDMFGRKGKITASADDVTSSVTSLEKDTESLRSSGSSVKSFSKRLKRSLKSSLLSVKEQGRHHLDDDDDDISDDDDVSSISSSDEMMNGSYLWMGGRDPNNNNFESRGDFLVIRGDNSVLDGSFMESLTSLATRVGEEKSKLEEEEEGTGSSFTDPNNNIQQVPVDRKPAAGDNSITDLIEDPQTYSESVNASLTSLATMPSKTFTKETAKKTTGAREMTSRPSFDRHGVPLPPFP